MSILLDWWTTEGNYANFRGDTNKGKKKVEIVEKLATKCNEVSNCKLTVKSFQSKIGRIEKGGQCMTG